MNKLDIEKTKYKNQLDQWCKSLGLSKHQPANDEVETVLGFTRETMRERSSVQLSEDAIVLAQYALFMQQKANECQTFIRWSSQVMNRLLGDDRSRLNQWGKTVRIEI